MKKRLGLALSIMLFSCGEKNSNTIKPAPAPVTERGELGITGLGDHSCRLTYQLVKKVSGMSSAQEFFEPDSGDLVSNQATRDAGFGAGCLSYCSTEFANLTQKYGADRVLVRNCSFVRQISTASVKGWVESYANGVVSGWACKFGQAASVPVELYLGGIAGTGAFVARISANGAPKDATDKASLAGQCGSSAAVHRFSYTMPDAIQNQHAGKAIFVHAIDTANSSKNFLIGNSGALQLPLVSSKQSLADLKSLYDSKFKALIDSRCVACHANRPTKWDTFDGVRMHAPQGLSQVQSMICPRGSSLSASERKELGDFLGALGRL